MVIPRSAQPDIDITSSFVLREVYTAFVRNARKRHIVPGDGFSFYGGGET